LVKREEAEHLARRAEEFMRSAELQAGENMYALAVFSLEQALQLFLKSGLILQGVDYRRTHSTRRLLTLLAAVSQEHRSWIDELLRRRSLEIAFLEDAYISSRYFLRDFGSEEYRRVRELVEEVMRNLG